MEALGRHLLLELYDCDAIILNDITAVEDIMIAAAEKAEGTILKSTFHQFEPQGVTGIIAIAESHLSIHTWPEYNYAAVDIFTCGKRVNPDKACNHIIEKLKAQKQMLIEVKRGVI